MIEADSGLILENKILLGSLKCHITDLHIVYVYGCMPIWLMYMFCQFFVLAALVFRRA